MTIPNFTFNSRAIFVIDVQQALTSGPDAVPDALDVLQAINHVLRKVRQQNDEAQSSAGPKRKTQIVFVQHNDNDPQDPLWKGKATWELTFPPREDDDAEVLVSKDVRNVFESNPQIAENLRSQGISQITVTGIQSDCCVLSSVLGAIASGFDASTITLLQGAHSTYNDDTTGRTYQQVKKDIEAELTSKGVLLQDWQSFGLEDL